MDPESQLGTRSDLESVVEERPTSREREEPAAERRSNMPKWERTARSRLREAVRRFDGPIKELMARDANEGDTRMLVTDFLCDVLGYDKYSDLTTEYAVRGQYADYGIRIDKDLVAFIEVKRIATKLNKRHLNQVQTYALNEGVEWILLTNGANWRAYHVTPALPVEVDLALDIDLSGPTNKRLLDQLFYLTRESLQRRQMDELWQAKRATAPESLLNVLLSESVIKSMRLELRRQTNHRVTDEEIEQLVRRSLIRDDLINP